MTDRARNRLSVRRLFWLHGREAFVRYFANHGMRSPPYPEPYPEPCWRWWRASNRDLRTDTRITVTE